MRIIETIQTFFVALIFYWCHWRDREYDEKIKLYFTTHRFESGQEFNGVVTLRWFDEFTGWNGASTEQLNLVSGETGIYKKIFQGGKTDFG